MNPPLIRRIQAIVARAYRIDEDYMRLHRRESRFCVPRQVAMYLSRELGNYSLPEIGLAFRHHHTTVLHSCAQVRARIDADPEFAESVRQLRKLSKDEDLIANIPHPRFSNEQRLARIESRQVRIEEKLDRILGERQVEAA